MTMFSNKKHICFLHVGTHKTGTTSIQHFMHTYRDTLAENDIYVPRTGCVQSSPHGNIAWELLSHSRFNPKFGGLEDLYDELSSVTPENVLLSAEAFSYLVYMDDAKRRLYEVLSSLGYEVYLLVYFRDQVTYACSLYSQLSKMGLSQGSFSDYVKTIAAYGEYSPDNTRVFVFDYEKFLQEWVKFFGEKIICRSYNSASLTEGGVIADFLAVLGLERDTFDEETGYVQLNPGGKGGDLWLSIKRVQSKLPQRWLPIQYFVKIVKMLVERADEIIVKRRQRFCDQVFREAFDESNRRLRHNFGCVLHDTASGVENPRSKLGQN